MMPGNTFRVKYGSHTFDYTSAKVSSFAATQNNTNKTAFLPTVFSVHSNTRASVTPAAVDGYELHGKWYERVYDAVDNKVVRITVAITRSGRAYSNAAIYLLIDRSAPSIEVSLNLHTTETNAVYSHIVGFTGPARVLEYSDLKDNNIEVHSGYTRMWMDPEEIGEIVQVTELSPESAPQLRRVDMKTMRGGTKKVVIQPKPKRIIRIRRRKV